MSLPLQDEAARATKILRGRIVKQVWRHRDGELGIEFEDGARLFADVTHLGLELGITEVGDESDDKLSD
jgi:hypothetical protein